MVEKILLAGFTAVESAHAFSAFCPSIFTIRRLALPQKAEEDIRAGYIPAIIFALALGFIVSYLIKNYLPLYFAIGTIIFMIAVYELSLTKK